MPEKPQQQQMNRREFLLNLGVISSLCLAGVIGVAHVFRYLLSRMEAISYRKVRAAALAEVPSGQSLPKTINGVPFILVNRNGTIRAFSAVCTHLGCLVYWRPEKQDFYCPCHGGIFDADGKNIAGPPPRPLDEYEVEVKDGIIYVALPKKQTTGA